MSAPVGAHYRQPDGRCSCKVELVADVVKAALAPVCPECRQGKHRNCDGLALDEAADEIVPCTCPPAFGHAPRQPEPEPVLDLDVEIVLTYKGRDYTLPELTRPGNEDARAEWDRLQESRGRQLIREAQERRGNGKH